MKSKKTSEEEFGREIAGKYDIIEFFDWLPVLCYDVWTYGVEENTFCLPQGWLDELGIMKCEYPQASGLWQKYYCILQKPIFKEKTELFFFFSLIFSLYLSLWVKSHKDLANLSGWTLGISLHANSN